MSNFLSALEESVSVCESPEQACSTGDRLLEVLGPAARANAGIFEALVTVRAALNLADESRSTIHSRCRAWLEGVAAHTKYDMEVVLTGCEQFVRAHQHDTHLEMDVIRESLATCWANADPTPPAFPWLSFVDTVPSGEALEAAVHVAAQDPRLHADRESVRSLLRIIARKHDWTSEIAGMPQSLLTSQNVVDAVMKSTRVEGEAKRIVLDEELVDPGAAAVLLGAKETNRERVRLLRERSELLGIRLDRRFVYPLFQFDVERRSVRRVVATVNQLLGSSEDPWGVASWWVSKHAALGSRPCDLVGGQREGELVEAAKGLVGESAPTATSGG